MVVELDRIFCNHDMHFVPSASFPKAIPLSGQQQTVAHQIDGCVGEIPACHIHEHFHLRMQQGFATKQLYFLDAVLCPHELDHSATISFEHRKFRIGFRSERREIVTSTAVQITMIHKMEMQDFYHVLPFHILTSPQSPKRKEFPPHEHQPIRYHSFKRIQYFHPFCFILPILTFGGSSVRRHANTQNKAFLRACARKDTKSSKKTVTDLSQNAYLHVLYIESHKG